MEYCFLNARLEYSITLNSKHWCISAAFKLPRGTSKCNHCMGNPASHSCGTTLDTDLEALISHKMSHEPYTETELKSMLTKLLALDIIIIGPIYTKHVFLVISFFPMCRFTVMLRKLLLLQDSNRPADKTISQWRPWFITCHWIMPNVCRVDCASSERSALRVIFSHLIFPLILLYVFVFRLDLTCKLLSNSFVLVDFFP